MGEESEMVGKEGFWEKKKKEKKTVKKTTVSVVIST